MINIKSSFGFFFTGLSTSKKLDRPLTDSDFPIENEGTTDPDRDDRLRNYKVCCQGSREFFIQYIYQPIASRGMLVRVSPSIVTRSFFYWEIVVFFEKVVLLLLASKFDQDLKNVQLVFAMLILSIFLILQVYNRPYFSKRLNELHNLSIFTCIWYCFCRVLMIGL